MRSSYFLASAAMLGAGMLATATTNAAELPGKVMQSAMINGFTVNLRAFPTIAKLHKPQSHSGMVTMGANADGISPYTGTPLAGSPFLSVVDGTVSFNLKAPAASVAFIWGTPDSFNVVEMYDTSNKYIGGITGGDITKAFPTVNNVKSGTYLQIVSPTPLGQIYAFSPVCCFEIGNDAAMYNTVQ